MIGIRRCLKTGGLRLTFGGPGHVSNGLDFRAWDWEVVVVVEP